MKNACEDVYNMKILLGLSGGVDSAVAAYLLKQQGHDVSCCFMRNWDSALNNDTLGNPTLREDMCPQEKDYLDAKKVAELLHLPLLRVDYIQEYWRDVFMNFVTEYQKGRTPNPDILCNKYIKFAAFRTFAKENGFPNIATGHYFKRTDIGGRVLFKKASYREKDQSYFLAQVSKEALLDSYFPLGDYTKPQVRSLAQALHLPIADKKDSTGVCFIGERDFRKFLQNYIPMKPGNIRDIYSGEIVGRHEGVYYYTLGQRKGFHVGGENGPYYCAGKDIEKNELYLASYKDESFLYSDSAFISSMNWLEKIVPGNYQAKFRYRQPDQQVYIQPLDEQSAMVFYPQKVKAVTPGQQAVFYDDDVLLGGGVIEDTYLEGKSVAKRLKERMQQYE